MADEIDTIEDTIDPAIEAKAREMGWVDEDSFQGDKSQWRDAREFVERGEHILPILQANNRKLRQELLTRDAKIDTLTKAVENSQKAISALQRSYSESTKQQVEQAKKELREQLKAAREIGDVDTELTLVDKMEDLRTAERESKAEAKVDEAQVTTKPPELHPEFVAWQKEHTWFGDESSLENAQRSAALVWEGTQLRNAGDTSSGRAFMDKCLESMEKREAAAKGGRPSGKVEGSTPGERRSTGGGNSFASLPKEVRDACHSDNETFVGPGKMFKTVKEWEDHFTKLYSEDN